jgi:hypothetical protein
MLSMIAHKFSYCTLILFSSSSSVLEKSFLLGLRKISLDEDVTRVALANDVSWSLHNTACGMGQ